MMDRIVHRFRMASQGVRKLEKLLDEALRHVGRGSYGPAYDAYNKFLREIGIFGAVSSSHVRVVSEWAHNMMPGERGRYERWVKDMLDVRERLRSQVFGTGGDVGDIEWDLGMIRYDFLEWVEPYFRDGADSFKHGPFQVILSDGDRGGLEEALKTLDRASAKVKAKFPKVLYGKVYVTRGVKSSYHRGSDRAGSYVPDSDSINLSLYATPDRDSVMTLIHELGHRYHTKFLKYGSKEAFKRIHADGIYASPYGRTSWEENFAETFLHYVLGKPLPEMLQRFMEKAA